MAACGAALALAACGTDTDSGGDGGNANGAGNGNNASNDAEADAVPDAEQITGEWVPQSVTIGGETHARPARIDDALVTIDPGPMAGSGGPSGVYAGCNHHGADLRIEDGRLQVGEPASTLIGCDDVTSTFEGQLMDVFTSDPRYELSPDGTLTLTSDNGDSMTLVRDDGAPQITGVRWLVESVSVGAEQTILERPEGSRNAPDLIIEPATTPEDGGDGTLFSGCNTFTADVVVRESDLRLGDGLITEMACPGSMEWEEALFGIFGSNPDYEVTGDPLTLTLTADNGDYMTLVRDAG
jgi:heat shock protein HslJ